MGQQTQRMLCILCAIHHVQSGPCERSSRCRGPRSWLLPFTAPAVAPTPPGYGPGPVRAAPLPSARVNVALKSFEIACGKINNWMGVPPPLRRRPPPSRHVPLAFQAAGRVARRNGLVHCPSRHRCLPVVGWVTASTRPRSPRTRRLGRVARPSLWPRAAGRAQLRADGWARKRPSAFAFEPNHPAFSSKAFHSLSQ